MILTKKNFSLLCTLLFFLGACRTTPTEKKQISKPEISSPMTSPEKQKISLKKPETKKKPVTTLNKNISDLKEKAGSTIQNQPGKRAKETKSNFTDKDFYDFATNFIEALNTNTGKRYSLTFDEVSEIYPEGIATIVQTGRDQWYSIIQQHLKNTTLKLKSVKRGSDFSIGKITPPPAQTTGSNTKKIPQIANLEIEILADGNPCKLIIKNMYYISGKWKIFRVDIIE